MTDQSGDEVAEGKRAVQPCGTYAAFQRHKRLGEAPCEPCRVASNAYVRQLRATSPHYKAEEYRRKIARDRALSRLRRNHPTEYRTFYLEEIAERK